MCHIRQTCGMIFLEIEFEIKYENMKIKYS